MTETMNAQVFYEPQDMRYEQVPVPKPGDDQVLFVVKACSICGSDVAYYYGDSSLETETVDQSEDAVDSQGAQPSGARSG